LHPQFFPLFRKEQMNTTEELVIEARGTERQYWYDLWRYRELFQILAWRDLAVRYKQTVIGIAWALVRPLLLMIIFTIVFSRIAKLPSEGAAPYAIMVFAAMLPWQFFAAALSESSNSLIQNANLISKIYFPRLIVPASSVITGLVDLLISFAIMVGMMVVFNYWPDWHVLFLPLFVVLAFGAATGAGLWLCALNVEYRDFRHIVPFIVQFGLYVSPVGFSSSVVPQQWRLFYSLNPMVGVIDGFRWAILRGDAQLYWPGLLLSIVLTIGLCYSGTWYFRKMERTFADLI
jgi:lipopolysaccharide transport system permease protein